MLRGKASLPELWFSQEVRPGFWVGFTGAAAGNLAFHVGDDPACVAANRAAVDATVGRLAGSASALRLQYMDQVHGREVAGVDAPARLGQGPTADAMVSRTASLAVMVADCVPVVFAGAGVGGAPILGVAHAGRPGVEKGIIGATVAKLRAAGAASLQAWIGPGVCGRCYEVPDDMRSAVSAVEPAAYSTTTWGTPALDLPAAVAARLAALGVPARNVGVCTMETRSLFSHRRSVRDGGAEGRFIGFAAVAAGARP